MSSWSPDTFARAWNFATLYHQSQSYGGPTKGLHIDYLNHVGSVAVEVLWALPSHPERDAELALQCALLHDVLEDTAATYELLHERFGQAVADGVLALTKNPALPDKQAQMEDSLRRIRAQSPEIWMVKLADRIANLYHPPYYWDNARIARYRQEALVIYETLHAASEPLARRLREKIAGYGAFMRPDEA